MVFFAGEMGVVRIVPLLGKQVRKVKKKKGGGGAAERPRIEITHILNLVLVEGRNAVDNNVGEAAAKVDNLVHHEGHDTGGEGVILHVQIPSGPEALEDIELDIDLGDLFEDGEVVGRCRRVEPGGDGRVEGGERRAPRDWC